MLPIINNLIENSDYQVLKESMPQKEHRYGHRYFTNQHSKHKLVSAESNVLQISPRKNPVKVKIVRVLGHFPLREIPVSRTISKGRSSTHLSRVIMRVASTSDIYKARVAESVYALFSLPCSFLERRHLAAWGVSVFLAFFEPQVVCFCVPFYGKNKISAHKKGKKFLATT